jgi:hypothetical protein
VNQKSITGPLLAFVVGRIWPLWWSLLAKCLRVLITDPILLTSSESAVVVVVVVIIVLSHPVGLEFVFAFSSASTIL